MTEIEVNRILVNWLRSSLVGCRETPANVDFAIGCASRWPGFVLLDNQWSWTLEQNIPRFTTKFRDALSLVPGDCMWLLSGDKSDPVCESAEVWSWLEEDGRDKPDGRRADMETPEEALAASAMSARIRARKQGRPVLPDTNWDELYLLAPETE